MDFIKSCFEEHSSAFMEKLNAAGFSIGQARRFLPVAATAITDSIQNSGANQLITGLISGGPSQLLSSVSVTEIATKLGMNSGLVTSGLEAIAPALSQAILQKSGGVAEAATAYSNGSSTGDFISATNKLFFN